MFRQDFVGPIQRAKMEVFFALARCLNVLISVEIAETHTCTTNNECCYSLLVSVFLHMKGVEDPNIDDQVLSWISDGKDFDDPFDLLRVIFKETQQCNKDLFRPFIVRLSERSECKCKDITPTASYKTVCITLLANEDEMNDAIKCYFNNEDRCEVCLAKRIESRRWRGYPRFLCIRIQRNREKNKPLTYNKELKVEGVNYKFRAALVFQRGVYHPYWVEGNELFTWQDGRYAAQHDSFEGHSYMEFFEKCMQTSTQ